MGWISNIKISQKLLLSFIISLFFIGSTALLEISNMKLIDSNFASMYNSEFNEMNRLQQLNTNMLTMRISVLRIIQDKDPFSGNAHEMPRFINQNNQILSEISNINLSNTQTELLNSLKGYVKQYAALANSTINYVACRDFDKAAIYNSQMRDMGDNVSNTLDKLVNDFRQSSQNKELNKSNAF